MKRIHAYSHGRICYKIAGGYGVLSVFAVICKSLSYRFDVNLKFMSWALAIHQIYRPTMKMIMFIDKYNEEHCKSISWYNVCQDDVVNHVRDWWLKIITALKHLRNHCEWYEKCSQQIMSFSKYYKCIHINSGLLPGLNHSWTIRLPMLVQIRFLSEDSGYSILLSYKIWSKL